MENIRIGDKYDYYDDGKIKESRRMVVEITDIIPFEKAETDLINIWKGEVEECDWLYAKTTDFFIKGVMDLTAVVFVRTLDNRWFSLGYWGGLSDVKNKLKEKLKNQKK